jgi:uncharacterized protein with HEPN domain
MQPELRDAAYLWDMLKYARVARRIAAGITLDRLLEDETSQLALTKAVELVGESAARLSPGFYAAHPELEWRPIIALRNRLVHDYGNTRFPILWNIVGSELPVLIPVLESLVEEMQRDDQTRENPPAVK